MSEGWSADRLFSTADQMSEVASQLAPRLTHVINQLSGLNLNDRQIGRLAGIWLLHLVHHAQGVCMSAAQSFHMRESPTSGNILIHIDRSEQAHAMRCDTSYRLAVESFISQIWTGKQLPDAIVFKRVSPAKPSRGEQSPLQPLHGIQRSLTKNKRSIWIVDPYLKLKRRQVLAAVLKSRRKVFWAGGSGSFELDHIAIDADARVRLANEELVEDFTSLVSSLIPLFIPIGYAEALSTCRQQLESVAPKPPRILYTATGIQTSHVVQVASSLWDERRTKLCVHQHGGHSGLDKIHGLEDHEVAVSDSFFTFGWQDGRPSVRPLAIAIPRQRRKRPKLRLLIMSLDATPYLYRFQPFCVPEHVTSCVGETHDFLNECNLPLTTVIRSEYSTFLQLKSACSILEWEPIKGSGPRSAANSTLVVHNYLGTSWLETLAMDIPTVCFIPKNIHRFRESAQPFADALIRVGVLHDSGRSAARFVNSLGGDSSGWWKSSEVQEARQAFVARYANFSDDWLDAWLAEFERILAE